MKLAVTVPEAAAMIGISESMLWKLLADGDLARVKIGRRTLIRVLDLERFLESHTEAQARIDRLTDCSKHDAFQTQQSDSDVVL